MKSTNGQGRLCTCLPHVPTCRRSLEACRIPLELSSERTVELPQQLSCLHLCQVLESQRESIITRSRDELHQSAQKSSSGLNGRLLHDLVPSSGDLCCSIGHFSFAKG